MKVLIIGGGGREHALAWKLVRESPDAEIVAAPGNPGIARLGRCVPIAATDVEALVALAQSERPAFTLVGPEAPLALGLVDAFRARGLPVFGPTRAAAEIETSKAFAKQLMLDSGVPTARATRHTDAADAKRAAHALGAPVVIKASGLAAGKGVVVARTLGEAERAVDDMLVGSVFGVAGAEVLVEEFMEGEELSVFYLTDGWTAIPLVPAQDHKRLLEGDLGPNTGGMGAYAPVTVRAPFPSPARVDGDTSTSVELSPALWDRRVEQRQGATPADTGFVTATLALDRIVAPTLEALRDAGRPFTGLLYAGLMLTEAGPRVVEFNCRFGDPETQVVLPVMDATRTSIAEQLETIARGGRIDGTWSAGSDAAGVATVLAAAGYPEKPRTGDPIELPDQLPNGVTLFHAGTALDSAGDLVTAGGRVLAVTAVADTFDEARARSLAVAEQVRFAGKHFRRDIGWREAARRSLR